ncbi:MAG: hypothetical protein WAM94_00935 [Chromatiaceae bacterium]
MDPSDHPATTRIQAGIPPLPPPGSYAGKSINALPFVSKASKWSVVPAVDYMQGCIEGECLADHLVLFLRENLDMAGGFLLRKIVCAMAAAGPFDSGVAIGFFGRLEERMAGPHPAKHPLGLHERALRELLIDLAARRERRERQGGDPSQDDDSEEVPLRLLRQAYALLRAANCQVE